MAFCGEPSVLKKLRGDRQIPIRLGIFTERDVSEAIGGVVRNRTRRLTPSLMVGDRSR